jgi:CheY-like chemotaxis protein
MGAYCEIGLMFKRQPLALVVDDEAQVRKLVGRALSKEQFACEFASDGVEALEMLLQTRYDLVVTDLQMPNRHGCSLVGDLLRLPQRPVIVVLTGFAEPAVARSLTRRGVDDISFKPVNFTAFAAKVKGLVHRRLAPEREFQGEATASTAPETRRLPEGGVNPPLDRVGVD